MVHRQRLSVRILRYVLRLGIQLLVFLALYILSIGPMFWLWFGAYYADGEKIFYFLYFPLSWLCDQSEDFREYINMYINWWILR
jgi:hypothetical protein